MSRALFVTGTDTGVGKTFVSCALARGLCLQRQRVAVFKPVAAGCTQIDGAWRNDDALALQQAAGNWQRYAAINPFALPAAIAPHIAAAEHGVTLSVRDIVTAYQQLSALHSDYTIVEGAGGFLVSLNAHESFAELVSALQLPVIVVVAMRLGCINHALLTVDAIRARGLRVLGWVANQPQAETMSHHADNIAFLRAHIPAPLLAEFGWQHADRARECEFARAVMDG
jgi:dethiobiotin synthetase